VSYKRNQTAIEDGYTHFISGFAKGIDLTFASIVSDLMETNPTLTLEPLYHIEIGCTQATAFSELIGKCKIVGIHTEEYSPSCYMKRNRIMVGQSQRVIAVYDGREKGGTLFTMRCAYSQNGRFTLSRFNLRRQAKDTVDSRLRRL
jgi:uncharacterized phage-like protein YoqJ